MGTVRSVEQLCDGDDSAWPDIVHAINKGGTATVLPPDATRSAQTLYRLQVTTRSVLGALAHNSGGLLVDDGWLRILGGGTDQLVDLATINGLDDPNEQVGPRGHLVVGQDVLGGYFAINGGDLPADPGEIAYWGPDTLDWTPLGAGHGDFVLWAAAGGTADFYRDLRWDGWRQAITGLKLNEGLSLYPPPCTAEGQDVGAASKRPVPMTELLAFYQDLATATDGYEGPVEFRVID